MTEHENIDRMRFMNTQINPNLTNIQVVHESLNASWLNVVLNTHIFRTTFMFIRV